jgi:hypothetical protein
MPFNSFPGGGPTITVEAMLKQPRLLARRLTDLTNKRFVADALLARGTADQVSSGAVLYQRSESIYADDNPSEVMPRAEYPRTGWSETVLAAAVHKHGLEFPVSDEQKRRNAMDVIQRGQRKLANSIVRYVDSLVITKILADPDIQTGGGADWTTANTDIVAEIATAIAAIQNVEEGYEPDTLVVNPAQNLDLIIDADIRAALPRESTGSTASVLTGRPVPLLGLTQILVTSQMTAGKALIATSNVLGTIADEAPAADEGYVQYNPGGNYAPINTKVYRNENVDETIVRAMRLPAVWIAEPKSGYILTSI